LYLSWMGDARLYEVLARIDDDVAETARRARCGLCSGVLHSAPFPRKPRGGPADLPAGYDRRRSFCCAVDGCRTRVTPPSVRFLGRKVYLGAVVVLVTALRHGTTPRRLARLRALLGVNAQTLARWRTWWRTTFTRSRFWKAARGALGTPVAETALPSSLLARFAGGAHERLVGVLRFLAPITTASGNGTLAEGQR